MPALKKAIPFILILLSLAVSNLSAQWSGNAAINTVVCGCAEDQREAAIVSNGQKQTMIFWRDYRSETSIFGGDIYSQIVDSAGYKQLAADGFTVNAGINGQFAPIAISDGQEGAIVAWLSNHGGFYENDVYAQRLSPDGALLWAAAGVPVSVMSGTAASLAMVSDHAGGAIIVWQYLTGNYDIYAQRLDSSGTALWGSNGMIVCSADESQLTPAVACDDSGGAIIVWQDSRNGAGNTDIYAQRISAKGQALWQTDGLVVCSAENGQNNPQIIADGQGGAIIVWDDLRTINDANIYAQRINAKGAAQWTNNGVALCTAAYEQSNPVIIAGGDGGALVAWHDMRSNSAYDIYAQRINAQGQAQWTTNGIGVCTASHNQQYPQAAADGDGGMLLCWQDDRNGDLGDIYAQRVSGSGAVLWNAGGAAICLADGYQTNPALTGDGQGGAIIAWEDQRGAADFNIYAQWIDAGGNLGGITAIGAEYSPRPQVFTLHQNYPNPFNPETVITYQLSVRSRVQLTVYNALGQMVGILVNKLQNGGTHSVKFNGRELPGGVYFYRLQTGNFSQVRKMILLR